MINKPCGRNGILCILLAALGCIVSGCRRGDPAPNSSATSPTMATAAAAPDEDWRAPDPCNVILAPHEGTGRQDAEIRLLQAKLRNETNSCQYLEKLGWLFVGKARASFDPGYYKLAEQCALCLESHQPRAVEALLLRGHVLQSLHRFKEAEVLARELVARRGRSFDYGLLGDVLMEQGNLGEAAVAYQRMVDEKPDLQAYARISHLRWLKGDLAGATKVMQLAVGAASPNATESAAWVNTRLGLLQFQGGKPIEASQSCEAALQYQPDYPPALLLRGRLLLADGKVSAAVAVLRSAVELNPLPEYQWVLIEALEATGHSDETVAVEQSLRQHGAATDPRTFALYLASRGESPAIALELARSELTTRSDVLTHDALAWALGANGEIAEARKEMDRALAEGTRDARLFLHAAVIVAKAGDKAAARRWFAESAALIHMLLPSERNQLQSTAAEIGPAEQGKADSTIGTTDDFDSRKLTTAGK
jgi:tetratricopeptide (TPR) repeat protein